jgi:hypothetical protein
MLLERVITGWPAKALVGTLGICHGTLGALGSQFMIVSHPTNWTPDGFKSGKDEISKKIRITALAFQFRSM